VVPQPGDSFFKRPSSSEAVGDWGSWLNRGKLELGWLTGGIGLIITEIIRESEMINAYMSYIR
jgi:hypothetical protein